LLESSLYNLIVRGVSSVEYDHFQAECLNRRALTINDIEEIDHIVIDQVRKKLKKKKRRPPF